MSTKSSLYFDDNFHLYKDGFDRDHVYLAFRRSVGPVEELIIKIPLVVWKEMRKQTIQPEERYLALTDAELRAEAERAVDDHRTRLASEPDSPIKGMLGILLFGPPESSREEMIERFIANYRPRAERTPMKGSA